MAALVALAGFGGGSIEFPPESSRREVRRSSRLWKGIARMRHVLSALVMNQPGVLAHISGMLASRAFNIDSLAVGETEKPEFSRITFVVNGDDRVLDQVRKQLEKIVTVVKVLDYSKQDYVERDLMLIKVSTTERNRSELKELVDIFRGKIIDVSAAHVMIEISGQERKIEAFIDLVRPFGILEMVRTGRVALLRENVISVEPEPVAKPPKAS
jgi:acetolactate synthase-1/3 small subunit